MHFPQRFSISRYPAFYEQCHIWPRASSSLDINVLELADNILKARRSLMRDECLRSQRFFKFSHGFQFLPPGTQVGKCQKSLKRFCRSRSCCVKEVEREWCKAGSRWDRRDRVHLEITSRPSKDSSLSLYFTTHYLVQQLIHSLYGRELFIHPFDVGFVGRHGITVSFRQKDDQETGHEWRNAVKNFRDRLMGHA